MPTPTLMPVPRQRFVDNSGFPLANGMVFTFAAGTSDKLAAFQDAAGLIPHENPIRLDIRGEATIYWLGNYKVDVRSEDGVSLAGYPVDNFNAVDYSTASAAGIVAALASLFASTGSSLLGFIQSSIGAVKTTVQEVLRRDVTLLDFMSDIQRAAVYSGDSTSHQTAFDKAATYMAATKRTVKVPPGTYNFDTTFAPNGGCFEVDPKAILRFTSTVTDVIRVRRGVSMRLNGCELSMTNAAWNGNAVVLDGVDHFFDTYPTVVTGATINSATFGQGTGLLLRAQNAGDYITFVNMSGFNFGRNLNYAYILSCGNSGTAGDPATWHWINSNKLSDSVSSAKHCSSHVGLPGVPAEVTANMIEIDHQTGASSEVPHYFFGASSNFLTGWVWDWDNSRGSPIVFEGSAVWNNVKTNVDTNVVTTAGSNKVQDMTGGETGQKYFFGLVQHMARSYLGAFSKVGQAALTWFPDAGTGSQYHAINKGVSLSFMVGADPYGVAYNLLNIREDGTVVVGDSNTNPTISTLRVNGAVFHAARATRQGTDNSPIDIFENASGTQNGSISGTPTSVAYNTASDYRLKGNVQLLSGSTTFIEKLRPVSWDWNLNKKRGTGFIAHELQQVSPASVTGDKDAVDANGAPIYQAVEYGSSEVIAHMVRELQLLRAEVTALKVAKPV